MMWYNDDMKKIIVHGLVPISEIAKVTETSSQNISNTYINNINGKDKRKMLKALAIGAYMMQEKLNIRDIIRARKLALAVKEADAEQSSN